MFTPLQERMERLNLLVIRGELKQFYGRFQGRVVDADGDAAFAIDDLFGVVEDHASRW